jgi:hypothetical protein
VSTTPDPAAEDALLFDPWTREYGLLGLRLERLAPGIVDAWIGPAAWRAAVNADPTPAPADLQAAAARLATDLPGMGYGRTRTEYLRRQVTALEAQARVLAGEAIPFAEQARLYFDIQPERVPEDVFAAAHAELDAVLPGEGSLAERRAAWRQRFQAPPQAVLPVLDSIAAEVRDRTTAHWPLPADESIELALVRDQPWGAYNWYLGHARSRIEINTDLPMQVDGLVDYLCHEGYPGHHTEHALREVRQYRGRGQGEYAIQLINTPESLISEGIATSACEMIFDGADDLAWTAAHVLPALEMQMDVERAARIRDATLALSGVSGNAAFLLHEDGRPPDEVAAYVARWGLRRPEEAAHHLRFLQSPLWRVYTFTYTYGHALLAPLLAGPDRETVFGRILTEPVYPTMLAESMYAQWAKLGAGPAAP